MSRAGIAGGIAIRDLDAALDEAQLRAFDASYFTDRVFRAEADDHSLRLVETGLDAPFHKTYPFDDIAGDVRTADLARAAIDDGGRIVGFALAERMDWNACLQITGLFVAPGHRGRGIGAALLAQVAGHASATGLPRIRLETQNTNVAAIRFYRRHGFRLCGIDVSLYDPARHPREFALHFDRQATPPAPSGGASRAGAEVQRFKPGP